MIKSDLLEPVAGTQKMRKVEEEAKERIRQKVREIVNKEFSLSLKDKEEEVEQIDERILQIQKALQLVRYGAVVNYYAQSVTKQTRSKPDSVSIHPTVRQIIGGKRPIKIEKNVEYFSPAKKIKIEPTEEEANEKKSTAVPEYVPPTPSDRLPQILDPRNIRHKIKRRFIIGNVSKWIQCDQREDLSTHKWMMYVRGDKDHPDVSDVVAKVRFLIHPSYSPHDLIEVTKPPYHLTRRGWGEFPARVQIFFKNELMDKSIDVIHQLRLDRTYTGLQTLGAETMVDVWLHDLNFTKAKQEENTKPISKALIDTLEETPEGLVIPHEKESNIASPSFLKTMQEPSENGVNGISDNHFHADENIKQNGNTQNNSKCNSKNVLTNGKTRTTYVKYKIEKDGEEYYLPITILPKNEQKDMAIKESNNKSPLGMEKSSLVIRSKSNGKIQLLKPSSPSAAKKLENMNIITSGTSLLNKKPLHFVRDKGTLKLADRAERLGNRAQVNGSNIVTNGRESILKSKVRAGTSLLKRNNGTRVNTSISVAMNGNENPNWSATPMTELEKAFPDISIVTWNKLLGRNPEDIQDDVENRLLKNGVQSVKAYINHFQFLRDHVLNRKSSDFSSSDNCIMYIARCLPLITSVASSASYRVLHPYTAKTMEEFHSWNLGKRLASEWQRAKTINRLLMNTPRLASAAKSTKQIRNLLREHGYSMVYKAYNVTQGPRFENSIPPTYSVIPDDLAAEMDSVLLKAKRNEEASVSVDVITIDNEEGKDENKVKYSITDSSLNEINSSQNTSAMACLLLPEDNPNIFKYISETSRQIDIRLSQEEIIPRVYYPAAEKLIYRAMKNFCERLIRKSYREAYNANIHAPPDKILREDVIRAIEQDDDFSLFTNLGLGKKIKSEDGSI